MKHFHVFSRRLCPALLLAALAALLLTACNPESTSSVSPSPSPSPSASASSQESAESQEPQESQEPDASPELQGEGTVKLLENLGSKEDGFVFAGTQWFSDQEKFLEGLAALWPEAIKGGLDTEYEDDASGVYVTRNLAQFSDFSSSAALRVTEADGGVTGCSYVFSFGESEQEAYVAAFLQARDMLIEAFGGADESFPAFDQSLPSGGTWYGADGSGLGISDTSGADGYQFEISLSAPQAQG